MSSDPKTPAELDAEHREALAQKRRENLPEAFKKNQWVKGMKAPNPGGRPKSLPRFRKRCRDGGFEILQAIRNRVAADTDGRIPLRDLVEALIAVSDRGGFISTKEEADIDAMRAKLVLAVLAVEGLKPEQQKKLLEAVGG